MAKAREFTEKYKENMSFANHLGAALMVVWIWPLFLLVVGFGYSYFWSASTIIYTLMRHHVDDTELDEVYLEEDEIDQGFGQAAPKPAAEPAPASKPGTLSLNVVVELLPPTSGAAATHRRSGAASGRADAGPRGAGADCADGAVEQPTAGLV